jgi:hypothetical protein
MAFRREVKLIFLSFSRFQHNKTLEATSEKKRLTIADALVALSLYTPDAHLEQV